MLYWWNLYYYFQVFSRYCCNSYAYKSNPKIYYLPRSLSHVVYISTMRPFGYSENVTHNIHTMRVAESNKVLKILYFQKGQVLVDNNEFVVRPCVIIKDYQQ